MPLCKVSYLDSEGIRHSVEVQAGSLYEAAARALKTFREHGIEPAGLAKLEIQVVSVITHELTVQQLEKWLKRSSKNPKEIVEKERLRELLGIK